MRACLAVYFLAFFSMRQFINSTISFSNCRKDTHGVFSEPVDPEEVHLLEYYLTVLASITYADNEVSLLLQLPDYHDIIHHPMDFSTLRKKLDDAVYIDLEQFEVGGMVILFCSFSPPSIITFCFSGR